MKYPGQVIQHGNRSAAVIAIQQQLNAKGCGPVRTDGDFDDDTFNALRLFQTRFPALNGYPLLMDGIAGPITWSALFGQGSVEPVTAAPNELLSIVLQIAAAQIGTVEIPAGSSNGRGVNAFQDAAGIAHGTPWSMAFIYWCFERACTELNCPNPAYKTGSVLEQWRRTDGTKILAANARINTNLIKPGQVFIMATGGSGGHCGFIESVENGWLTTIEGAINDENDLAAIGVFRRRWRTINAVNEGFIQFA